MTLATLRNEVWKLLGESSDLNPTTDIQISGTSWVDYAINESQRAVAFWKQRRSNKRLRIPSLLSSLNFQVTVIEGTLEADGTTLTVTLPASDIDSDNDRYNDWLVEVNGETRFIVDSGSYVLTVGEAFSSAPETGDTYKLTKNFVYLLPSTHVWVDDHVSLPDTNDIYLAQGNFLRPVGIYDITNKADLSFEGDKELLVTESISTPASFVTFGNKIVFDTAFDEDTWYRLEYYRLPKSMTLSTDVPEIPEVYHYAIILNAVAMGFARLQDYQTAYKFESQFEDFLTSRLSMDEMISERQKDVFKVRLF